MARGDGETDVVDLSGNGKGVALDVYPDTGVVEYTTVDDFPVPGVPSVIYIDESNGQAYRWDGDSYSYEEIADAPPAPPVTNGDKGDVVVSGGGTVWAVPDLALKANLAGGNTFTGAQAFSSAITVPDHAFGVDWNGSTQVPTKNAVYDRIQEVANISGGVSDGDKGDVVVSGAGTVWTVPDLALKANISHTHANFTAVAAGFAPASGGGTGNFLRADGSWVVPPSSGGSVSDTAYGGTWNGATTVAPSQNAVYDKIESLVLGAGGTVSDAIYGAGWNGVTTTAPSQNAVYDKIEAVIATIPAAPSTVVSDVAYAASWNAVTTIAPSKNAVYDKIEAVIATIPAPVTSIVGITGTKAEFNTALTDDDFAYLATANTFTGASQTFTNTGNANAVVNIQPIGTGIYSTLNMKGVGASIPAGLVILAGSSNAYFNTDTFTFRNAGSTANYLVLTPTLATFINPVVVPDEAYGATWASKLQAPTKKAVYDKIQSMSAGGGLTDGDKGDVVVGGTGTTLTVESATPAGGTFAVTGGMTVSGNMSITGQLTAANLITAVTGIEVPDEAYGVGWNGDLSAPTKNALYDKIEAVAAGGGGVADNSITYAKLQDASAGNVVLARANATAGDYAEVAVGAQQLVGRGTSGDIAALAIGATLSFGGTATLGVASVPQGLQGAVDGTGIAAGVLFNGSVARTISWNTVGALPLTPRKLGTTSATTVTPTFLHDFVVITAQAQAFTLANPTGTAIDGHGISIRIKDNGTGRGISYGSQYRAIGVTLPTTTVANKTLYMGMIYNSADTKWDVVSVAQEA